jgi:malonate transporter
MFLTILTALVPSFLLVGLGGWVRGRLSENAWTGLDRLNFDILFPALLFSATASRPIPLSQVAVIGLSVWALLFAAMGLAYLCRPLGPERFINFAGLWQCSWRFNTALGLVAANSLTPSATALMPILVGMAVPLANILAVSALSRGHGLGLFKTIKTVAKNPFFLASFSGVLVGMSGMTIPAPIMAPIDLLAAAAIPLALLSIGATMDWTALARLDRFRGLLNTIKLIAMPIMALLIGQVFSLPPDHTSALIVFAALPTASAAHVLAAGFGAERRPVATMIAQSTLISAVTLPIWVFIAAYIGTH